MSAVTVSHCGQPSRCPIDVNSPCQPIDVVPSTSTHHVNPSTSSMVKTVMTTLTTSQMASPIEFVEPIIEKWKRARQTRFAKSNNTTVDHVVVHQQLPVDVMYHDFRQANMIKARTFKGVPDEMKQQWLRYFDEHKQMTLMTDRDRDTFMSTHKYNPRKHEWVSTVETAKGANVNGTMEAKPKRKPSPRPKGKAVKSETMELMSDEGYDMSFTRRGRKDDGESEVNGDGKVTDVDIKLGQLEEELKEGVKPVLRKRVRKARK